MSSRIVTRTLLVAASGTKSQGHHEPGSSLEGLEVPALDSTTIGFEFAHEDVNASYVTVKTNSGAAAAITLGNADTGSKVVAVPEEVGRLAGVGFVRLVVASQTGGARSIKGLYQQR